MGIPRNTCHQTYDTYTPRSPRSHDISHPNCATVTGPQSQVTRHIPLPRCHAQATYPTTTLAMPGDISHPRIPLPPPLPRVGEFTCWVVSWWWWVHNTNPTKPHFIRQYLRIYLLKGRNCGLNGVSGSCFGKSHYRLKISEKRFAENAVACVAHVANRLRTNLCFRDFPAQMYPSSCIWSELLVLGPIFLETCRPDCGSTHTLSPFVRPT